MNIKYPPEFIADAKAMPGKVLAVIPEIPMNARCKNCGDLGFMHAWYVRGEPTRYLPAGQVFHYDETAKLYYLGGLRAAPCPVCANQKVHDNWMQDISGLDEKDLEIRIEQFDPVKGKVHAREMANLLLAMTPSPRGFTTFYGDYGTGKTMILKALVNGFRIAGVTSSYVRMADCLADVRDQFDSGAKAAETVLERYKSIKVLAIDEIDRVNWTSWAKEAAFRILDGRYDKKYCQLTILASNKQPDEFPEELGYLVSRMKSGDIVKLEGDDMRVIEGMMHRKDYE